MLCKSMVACALVLLAAWDACLAYSVTFVNPGRANEVFWVSASRSMEMAATSLNIDLNVRYAERLPEKMLEIVKEIAAAKKIDYLIFTNEYALGGEVLKITEAAGIKTFFAYSTRS